MISGQAIALHPPPRKVVRAEAKQELDDTQQDLQVYQAQQQSRALPKRTTV
ncbi:MAG: hypothetical protein ACPIOQ_57700 [Promethearchaeia archaeon]